MAVIHRWSLDGRSVCGENGRMSSSGAFVTCEKCLALTRKPSREEMLAALERAVDQAKRATELARSGP